MYSITRNEIKSDAGCGEIRWRDGEMERWRDGEMERWRDGEMERWRDGERWYKSTRTSNRVHLSRKCSELNQI